jgi:hypothetical protein
MKSRFISLASCLLLLAAVIPAKADYMLAQGTLGSISRIPIPALYTAASETYVFGNAGLLSKPRDLFVDNHDRIYIADTGNNRVLKLGADGSVERIYDTAAGMAFKGPQGVYVDRDGDVYIADTGNKRIVHLTTDGALVEVFGEPTGQMGAVEEGEFMPTKLYLSLTGYLYVIKQYSLMSIDGTGAFKGFVASSTVKLTLGDMLLRGIFTEEQKRKLAKLVPESFLNFVITDDGMIYGTTLTDKAQIKKINGVGKNLYPDGWVYGEQVYDTQGSLGRLKNPELVDIAVDRNGIVTVIDRNTCNLYQYGQDGTNIGVFGGPGVNRGNFEIPSSLAVDSAENLYVLDSEKGSLQVLAPTQYCRFIHSALAQYYDGKYVEAVETWQQVLQLHAGNRLAHIGIGKALYKQGLYQEAMAHYRIARDRPGYSDAFRELRHNIFRANFIWVILAALGIVAAIVALARLAKAFAAKELK